ncbi:tautomerase family protein [Ramlibacter henchirensis]|uniref:Tautomerase family protein n=1 Tax=Ramlibacter henchirensis TaxID=204072 RepID=A0A4Z0CAF2_9BURK|nr:tautomerase family protein [Ramlibacter henchirensis]TFZ07049.1 tautomerase family protein [Ramlibacter henchirensis]
MPLVRIDLPASASATEAAAASRAVHQALVEVFSVPQDDMFQVVARRPPGEIVCTPTFLGVDHSDKVAFVQIVCSPGRTVGLKEALYARIAEDVAAGAGLRREDVIINLLETARENWSFGNGLAQYALIDRQPPTTRGGS